MEVADGGFEKPAAHEAEDRVAEVAMQERHGSGSDAAGEAVAHDEVGAIAQFGEETWDVREVVAVVGVGHEDVLAARCGDAGVERCAVSASGHENETCAVRGCDGLRAVGGTVVGDDDFAGDVVVAEYGDRFIDTRGERLRLVEAGHHYGEFDCRETGYIGSHRRVWVSLVD